MPSRRQAIAAVSAALALVPWVSCRRKGPQDTLPPGAIRVALSELPEGEHVTRMRLEEPVDLVRTGTTVVARSLFCTHFGCRLAWNAAAGRFQCPCHLGAFDPDGRPVAGPPMDPMRILPVRVEEGTAVILPRGSVAE
jgi:Rieske Fe-S protein